MTTKEDKAKEKIQEQLKRYDQQIEKVKAKKREIQRKEREKKRKSRTRKLIQIGGLAEIAGLQDFDTGVLLGMLLNGKELLEDEPTYNNFKKLGDSTLRYRERKRKKKG